MGKYTITLTKEEEKALLSDMKSIQEWIENAIYNKARQCMDAVVTTHSDKQAKKISRKEKYSIVHNADVETAVERQARQEAQEGL